MPKIALLCSGLGVIRRGHEVFARDLFNLLKNELDITIFKGGGEPSIREIVVNHIPRQSLALNDIHLPVAPKWASAAKSVEQMRIEAVSFAWGALGPLLEGKYDIIHCLEEDVCNTIYSLRHLFQKTPKILWSNGGAIPKFLQPNCDFIQEHTEYNLRSSNKKKGFSIPHGVDLKRFNQNVTSDFRATHGIPKDAFVVISVGTICYWHKRMDYIIREVASVPGIWLIIVGQESPDAPAIRSLGEQLMGERIVFTSMQHEELPIAYAAADVFALGSLFETFGIVYIEAMAMGLPVICTNHPNQISIVKEAEFIDMSKTGELANVLRKNQPERWAKLAKKGLKTVQDNYEISILKERYISKYKQIANSKTILPSYSYRKKIFFNLISLFKSLNNWKK